ncbi:MAG: hypothetical protein ACE5MH_10250, partial [Terriglobia bacterium]
ELADLYLHDHSLVRSEDEYTQYVKYSAALDNALAITCNRNHTVKVRNYVVKLHSYLEARTPQEQASGGPPAPPATAPATVSYLIVLAGFAVVMLILTVVAVKRKDIR